MKSWVSLLLHRTAACIAAAAVGSNQSDAICALPVHAGRWFLYIVFHPRRLSGSLLTKVMYCRDRPGPAALRGVLLSSISQNEAGLGDSIEKEKVCGISGVLASFAPKYSLSQRHQYGLRCVRLDEAHRSGAEMSL